MKTRLLKELSTWRKSDYVSVVFRLFIGGLFIVSGLLKINIHLTALSVIEFGIEDYSLARNLAIAMIIGEITAGLMLVLGIKEKLAALGLFSLLVVFIVGISHAWYMGWDLNCGCFGYGEDPTITSNFDYIQKILFDVVLLIITASIMFIHSDKLKITRYLTTLHNKN